MKPTLRERLLSRLVIDPSGCLLWTGKINRDGYGRIWADGHFQMVHRVAWQLQVGPIAPGLELDHVKARGCAHRHCANIAHLEPVTHRENVLRTDTLPAINAAKKKCHNGHLLDAANTYVYPRGDRNCRTCMRAASRRYKARKKAAA